MKQSAESLNSICRPVPHKAVISNFFLIMILICSCSRNDNRKNQTISNNSTKNISTKIAHKKTQNDSINYKFLLGIWSDEDDPNASFVIRQDSIYYPDEDKSYKYYINNDSLSTLDKVLHKSKIVKITKDSLILYVPETFMFEKCHRFTD